MNSDKDALSFGRYLQAVRLDKKISLEKVSAETRIGLGTLLLIEREDHERLPASVFVKGFIRAYAAAIGADGDDAVRRYESRLVVVKRIAESEAPSGTSTAAFWWKFLFVSLLFFCIIFLSIYGVMFYQHQVEGTMPVEQTLPAAIDQPSTSEPEIQTPQPVEADTVPPMAEPETAPPMAEPETAPPMAEPETAPAMAEPESWMLQISALAATWLKVVIDGKDTTEYSLKAGDQIELEASSGFNLLIGNAAGLKIVLNGQPISIPGESGQVVKVHLP
jgi:cytoskeleton protein RodZ